MSAYKRNFYILLLFVFSLILIYSPVVTNTYEYHDSFQFINAYLSVGKPGIYQPFINVLIAGRSLYALIYFYTIPFLMHGVETAWHVKFIGIITLGISAYFLYRLFIKINYSRKSSAAISILCFCLPGIQQFVYTSHTFPYTLSFPLVIFSFFFYLRFIKSINEGKLFSTSLFLTLSLFLLTSSALLYQSVTECFLALIFLNLISNSRQKTLDYIKNIFIGVLIYLISILLYISIHYIIDVPILRSSGISLDSIFSSERSIGINANIGWQTIGLFYERTIRAFSLWFYGSGKAAAYPVILFFIMIQIGIILKKCNGNKHKKYFFGNFLELVKVLGIFCLFTLASNIIIFTQINDGLKLLFRTMIAYQWLILFYLLFLLSKIESEIDSPKILNLFRSLCIILVVLSGLTVSIRLYYNFVYPNKIEYSTIQNKLASNSMPLDGDICIINTRPIPDTPVSEYFVIDEFGRTTGSYWFDISSLISAAAKSKGISLSNSRLLIEGAPDFSQNHCKLTIDIAGK